MYYKPPCLSSPSYPRWSNFHRPPKCEWTAFLPSNGVHWQCAQTESWLEYLSVCTWDSRLVCKVNGSIGWSRLFCHTRWGSWTVWNCQHFGSRCSICIPSMPVLFCSRILEMPLGQCLLSSWCVSKGCRWGTGVLCYMILASCGPGLLNRMSEVL